MAGYDYSEEDMKKMERKYTIENLQLIRRQAIYDIIRSVVPKPTETEAELIATGPSHIDASRPRWLDFLDPIVHKVVINLQAFLDGKSVVDLLSQEESDLLNAGFHEYEDDES